MKKLTAIIAAALAALSVTAGTVFAVTDESSTQSIVQESKAQSSAQEVSENVIYNEYEISSIGMKMEFPNTMYVLTRDMSEDDPALEACKLTKEEVLNSFKASDTYIKATAPDFSYDITITMVKNSDTATINDLTELTDDEVQEVTDKLLEQSVYTGCSKSKFNNTLFLSLELEYDSDNTKIYGIQEYTIINGTKVVVTFQSYGGEITDEQKDIMTAVMNSVTFEGVDTTPQTSTNVGSTLVSDLDIRYIYIIILSVLGISSLAAMIIVAMKYKSKNAKITEEPDNDIIESENENNNKASEKDISQKNEQILKDIFDIKSADDDIIYKDSPSKKENIIHTVSYTEETKDISESDKNDKKTENKIDTKKTATIVEEKADDKKTTIKLVNNSVNEDKNKEEVIIKPVNENKEPVKHEIKSKAKSENQTNASDEVVFAESSPVPHTKIEQATDENVSSDVVKIEKQILPKDKNEEKAELSEYEKRFGKNKAVTVSTATTDTNEKEPVSKFEQRFGKITTTEKVEEKKPEPIAKVEEKKPEPVAKAEGKKSEPVAKVEEKKPEPVAKAEEKKPEPAAKVEENKSIPIIKSENDESEKNKSTEKELSVNNPNKLNINKDINIDDSDEDMEKKNIFTKLKDKIFNVDEDIMSEVESDSQAYDEMESKQMDDTSLWGTIKHKLKNHNVENDEESTLLDEEQYALEIEKSDTKAQDDTSNVTEKKDIESDNKIPDNKNSIDNNLTVDNTLTYSAQNISSDNNNAEISKFEKRFGANRQAENQNPQPKQENEEFESNFEKKFGHKKPIASNEIKVTVPAVSAEVPSVPQIKIIKTVNMPQPEKYVDNTVKEKPVSPIEDTSTDFFEGIKPVEEKIAKTTEDTANNTLKMDEASKENTNTEIASEISAMPEEPPVPAFDFERDTGIIFEHALPTENTITFNKTPLTSIPRLESVQAAVYNKQMEEERKTVSKTTSSTYSSKFGNSQNITKPEPPKQPKQTSQPKKPAKKLSSDDVIEYYTGYDETADPYAGQAYQEKDKKNHDKNKGKNFMKSITKLFATEEDDDDM